MHVAVIQRGDYGVGGRESRDAVRQPSQDNTMVAKGPPVVVTSLTLKLGVKRALSAAAVNGSNRIAPGCPRSPDINVLTCLDDPY